MSAMSSSVSSRSMNQRARKPQCTHNSMCIHAGRFSSIRTPTTMYLLFILYVFHKFKNILTVSYYVHMYYSHVPQAPCKYVRAYITIHYAISPSPLAHREKVPCTRQRLPLSFHLKCGLVATGAKQQFPACNGAYRALSTLINIYLYIIPYVMALRGALYVCTVHVYRCYILQ